MPVIIVSPMVHVIVLLDSMISIRPLLYTDVTDTSATVYVIVLSDRIKPLLYNTNMAVISCIVQVMSMCCKNSIRPLLSNVSPIISL